jgi:hypothetical protein
VDGGHDNQRKRGVPGGIIEPDFLDTAEALSRAGIDPVAIFESPDSVLVQFAIKVAQRVSELEDKRDENRAVRIANAVGRLFKK